MSVVILIGLSLTVAVLVSLGWNPPTQAPPGGSGAISVNSSGNIGIGGDPTAHPFTIFTALIERLRIDTSGNVIIGGTGTPLGKLHVSTDSGTGIYGKTQDPTSTGVGVAGVGGNSGYGGLFLTGATGYNLKLPARSGTTGYQNKELCLFVVYATSCPVSSSELLGFGPSTITAERLCVAADC